MSTTTTTTEAFAGDGSADKAIFPDGYKTSGQHPPLPSRVHPYEDYPQHITGPTVWQAAEYRDSPEKWTHSLTDDEIREIEQATDQFILSGQPLTGITKVSTFLISEKHMTDSPTGPFPPPNTGPISRHPPQQDTPQRPRLLPTQAPPRAHDPSHLDPTKVGNSLHGPRRTPGLPRLAE